MALLLFRESLRSNLLAVLYHSHVLFHYEGGVSMKILKCDTCKGSGNVYVIRDFPTERWPDTCGEGIDEVDCPDCDGTGLQLNYCPNCGIEFSTVLVW